MSILECPRPPRCLCHGREHGLGSTKPADGASHVAMITRLTLVAWDSEGSDRAARLPQYQRHILNRRTTRSDSSFVLITAIQAIAQGTRHLAYVRVQRRVPASSWGFVVSVPVSSSYTTHFHCRWFCSAENECPRTGIPFVIKCNIFGPLAHVVSFKRSTRTSHVLSSPPIDIWAALLPIVKACIRPWQPILVRLSLEWALQMQFEGHWHAQQWALPTG